ncbi:MAG: putative lipid II flippase FtsW [candidate division Zixibacteria bacterium]|nr:putative lipid II flippase FtsW [candidate division Zixibacteria bacterium]
MTDRSKPDFMLLSIVLILVLLGILMIYSASAIMADFKMNRGSSFFLMRQIFWVAFSSMILLLLLKIDYHRLKRISYVSLFFSLVFLGLVLLLDPTKGVRRWIKLGPIGFQPSEFFRYSFILFLAFTLVKKGEKIKAFKHLALPYLVILGVACLLLLKEPHLGGVFTLVLSSLVLLFLAGARLKHLLVITLPVVISGLVFVLITGYEKDRLIDWAKALKDPLQGSYQLKQAVLSLGNGGLTGVGLGEGGQKLFFLPEPHTDFILATIGEEGGFLLISLVIILFFGLVWRGLQIAQRSPDLLGYYLAFGLTFSIFINFLINSGVVLGLLPTTGIPMPFLSYGGSSLLFNLAGIGIILNISRQRGFKIYKRLW